MHPVSHEVIARAWDRVSSMSSRRAWRLTQEMGRKQPLIAVYLGAADHDILDEDERDILLHLGVVVWQAMSNGKPMPKVTEKCLEAAEARNIRLVESIGAGTLRLEPPVAPGEGMGEEGQSELLGFVLASLLNDSDDGLIRRENVGVMLFRLKIVIESLAAVQP